MEFTGGGVLGKKPNELEKFRKNKKQKRIVIGSIIGVLLLGCIVLIRSYALYKEEKTFNIIKGQIPNFKRGDIELAVLINGISSNRFPSKEDGYTIENITCDQGATGTWDKENWAINISQLSISKTTCTISFRSKFNKYLIDLSEKDNSIEKIEHEATSQTPALTDYRYIEANPNNYVYFGCESNECTEDNLYRIIGVFLTQSNASGKYENRVKLVKATPWGSQCYWHNDGNINVHIYNNYWENSTLKSTLNTQYWNSLGEYQNYIEPAQWYLGALAQNNYVTHTPNQFYKSERGNNVVTNHSFSYNANIGLMYPSDYGYSIGKGYQDKSIYSNRNDYNTLSWLSGYSEWTITHVIDYDHAWIINADHMTGINVYGSQANVRPTFYLKENVQYKSGDGTSENPYRIGIDY